MGVLSLYPVARYLVYKILPIYRLLRYAYPMREYLNFRFTQKSYSFFSIFFDADSGSEIRFLRSHLVSKIREKLNTRENLEMPLIIQRSAGRLSISP